jgi:3-methylfumaryl-CoA hydratase
MPKDAPQLDDLKSWIGRTETVVDEITVPSVRRINALLDHDPSAAQAGDVFPRGWQGTLCPPLARQSDIGDDGHPKRGVFIPPIPFARRMAASVEMTFHSDLLVGDTVRRESVIEDLSFKKGRSGEIFFLTQKNEFYSPRGLAVTERHLAAFRDVRAEREVLPLGERASVKPDWQKIVTADPVMVFRYAAVAFSGHRIHYDYVYGTNTESYTDVMVSGGLNLMLLFDLVRQNVPGRLTSFSSRNLRPLYVNERLHICGAFHEDRRHLRLWITDSNGILAVAADAELNQPA